MSKMTINYDLENSNLDFRLVFLFSRSDYAVFSTDDSALSENTKDNLDTCRTTQGNAVYDTQTCFCVGHWLSLLCVFVSSKVGRESVNLDYL